MVCSSRLRVSSVPVGARLILASGAMGLAFCVGASGVAAQQAPQPQPPQAPPSAVGLPVEPNPVEAVAPNAGSTSSAALPQGQPGASLPAEPFAGGSGTARLLATPVVRLFPGNVPVKPKVTNPVGDSPQAAERGMRYFTAYNCVGCHAPNGAGGMGPSLSNSSFIYGSEPAQIYLTIYQGRPRGMPTWGAMLPDATIWDLVAYVRSISKDKTKQWGTTVSSRSPQIEQVPAEYEKTADPWGQTEAFSYGQKPDRAK